MQGVFRAAPALWILLAVAAEAGQGAALDRALDEFWSARGASERESRVAPVLGAGGAFDALYDRLRTGRLYSKDVKTGLVEESRRSGGLRQEYAFLVPEDYDPAKKYRACFYLHGGVNRPEPWKRGESWWRRFDRFTGTDQISVFPSSWRGSRWWQSSQAENLEAILDRLKREYNLDENRVFLFGVSDGATGVFYHAATAPTRWAAFFSFIGHPGVLENPAAGADVGIFFSNLVNRPLFIVNGEKDRLYPADRVRPYVEDFERLGVDLLFRVQPGGHNTRWWNAEREEIEAFLASHPRDPLPDRLAWETDRPSRLHWLVVDELAEAGAGGSAVELVRSGNRVEVSARGLSRYRLLLSPQQFDLSAPVEIVTNGARSFRGKVERDPETLLRWAARDDDRTALYGAEVEIALRGSESPP